MQSGQDRYFDNLIKFFPEEEAVIRKYEQLISVSATFVLKVSFLQMHIHSFIYVSASSFTHLCKHFFSHSFMNTVSDSVPFGLLILP